MSLFSSLKSKIVLYVMEMDRKEKHYWELGTFLYGLDNSGTNKLEFLNTFFQTKCILIELLMLAFDYYENISYIYS